MKNQLLSQLLRLGSNATLAATLLGSPSLTNGSVQSPSLQNVLSSITLSRREDNPVPLLILEQTENPFVQVAHRSHSSHRSHTSHRSHVSSHYSSGNSKRYSGPSGFGSGNYNSGNDSGNANGFFGGGSPFDNNPSPPTQDKKDKVPRTVTRGKSSLLSMAPSSPSADRKEGTETPKDVSSIKVVRILDAKSAVLVDEKRQREATVKIGDKLFGWTVTKINPLDETVTLTDEDVIGVTKPSLKLRKRNDR